jgi:hypothetical protein
MVWVPSTAHNWKCPGSDQIQNYLLKAFPAAHRHITRNFNAIMEEPEKIPDWLTTRVSYLLPKSGDSKEVRNCRPITCLMTNVQNPNTNNSQKTLHTSGRAELITSSTKRTSHWE